MPQNKISTYRRNGIFACFCRDVTATAAAGLAGVNRNTANYYYGKIRTLILQASSLLDGGRETSGFEADGPYFGARRVRGKRGRGGGRQDPGVRPAEARGQGIRENREKLLEKGAYARNPGKILKKSAVYTDGRKGYDGLVVNGYDHYRVFRSRNEFVRERAASTG